MSAGKEAARDIRYGRRGGRWLSDGYSPATSTPCDVCAQPMTCGQRGRHYSCCPGLASTKAACSAVQRKTDNGTKVDACAICHLGWTA